MAKIICKNISVAPLRIDGEKKPPGTVYEIDENEAVRKFIDLGHLIELAKIDGNTISVAGREYKLASSQPAAAPVEAPKEAPRGKAFTR